MDKNQKKEREGATLSDAVKEDFWDNIPFVKNSAKWIYNWVRNELKGMKNGWKLFTTLTIALVGLAVYFTYSRVSEKYEHHITATNAFMGGIEKQHEKEVGRLEASVERVRSAGNDEIVKLKLDINETKRQKDSQIAMLAGERDAALLRVNQLESLPKTAAMMYSSTTNLLGLTSTDQKPFGVYVNRTGIGHSQTQSTVVKIGSENAIFISLLNRSKKGVDRPAVSIVLESPTNATFKPPWILYGMTGRETETGIRFDGPPFWRYDFGRELFGLSHAPPISLATNCAESFNAQIQVISSQTELQLFNVHIVRTNK